VSVPYCTAAITLANPYLAAHPVPLDPRYPSVMRPALPGEPPPPPPPRLISRAAAAVAVAAAPLLLPLLPLAYAGYVATTLLHHRRAARRAPDARWLADARPASALWRLHGALSRIPGGEALAAALAPAGSVAAVAAAAGDFISGRRSAGVARPPAVMGLGRGGAGSGRLPWRGSASLLLSLADSRAPPAPAFAGAAAGSGSGAAGPPAYARQASTLGRAATAASGAAWSTLTALSEALSWRPASSAGPAAAPRSLTLAGLLPPPLEAAPPAPSGQWEPMGLEGLLRPEGQEGSDSPGGSSPGGVSPPVSPRPRSLASSAQLRHAAAAAEAALAATPFALPPAAAAGGSLSSGSSLTGAGARREAAPPSLGASFRWPSSSQLHGQGQGPGAAAADPWRAVEEGREWPAPPGAGPSPPCGGSPRAPSESDTGSLRRALDAVPDADRRALLDGAAPPPEEVDGAVLRGGFRAQQAWIAGHLARLGWVSGAGGPGVWGGRGAGAHGQMQVRGASAGPSPCRHAGLLVEAPQTHARTARTRTHARTHARTATHAHARTHARTHARARARTHARTHARTPLPPPPSSTWTWSAATCAATRPASTATRCSRPPRGAAWTCSSS
jgi:hypothetical protein